MTHIPTVNLGEGLTVSEVGFGGMALSHVYGDTDPDQALRILHRAIDQGVAFIDTAAALVHGGRELTFTSKDWISANRE